MKYPVALTLVLLPLLWACDQFEKRPSTNPLGPGVLPLKIEDLGLNVVSLSAGRTHSCAVLNDGKTYCWGSNRLGEIGSAEVTEKQPQPQLLAEAPEFTQVTAGDRVTCGLTKEKTVFCWGDNSYYQLGQGESTATTTAMVPEGEEPKKSSSGSRRPLPVVDTDGKNQLQDVVSLFSTSHRVCAISRNEQTSGRGVCCGAAIVPREVTNPSKPSTYELGLTRTGTPQAVQDVEGGTLGLPWESSIKSLAILEKETCAITSLDQVRCQSGIFDVSNPLAIAGNGRTYCVTAGSGDTATYCYKNNREAPVRSQVEGLPKDIIDISVGPTHACGVTRGGNAWCWGNNRFGQLGNGQRQDQTFGPVQVQGLGPAKQISVGAAHTCAVLFDGSAWCWGSSESGQIGPTS